MKVWLLILAMGHIQASADMTKAGMTACEQGAAFMTEAFRNSPEIVRQFQGQNIEIKCIFGREKPRG